VAASQLAVKFHKSLTASIRAATLLPPIMPSGTFHVAAAARVSRRRAR
jgi:hypothetical protein